MWGERKMERRMRENVHKIEACHIEKEINYTAMLKKSRHKKSVRRNGKKIV